MKIHSRLMRGLVLLAALLCVGLSPIQARAEMQEANFIEHDGGDLAFSFFYEADIPELVFISPSGVEYAEGVSAETELVIGRGEGWSNYRIPNAEAGQWRLRYDKKNNATIEYVEVKPIEAIAIQSFALAGVDGNVANVSFMVMKGDEKVRFDYAVSLVDGAGNIIRENLCTGRAETGAECTASVKLNVSTGSDYKLMLNVSHRGETETFDSALTEVFSYTNPATPAALADFAVKLDSERSKCTVDWSGYQPGGRGYTYKILAIADGDRENPIFSAEEKEQAYTSFFYPTDATKLEIEICYYKEDGLVSEVKAKTVALSSGEYLKIPEGDIVGDALLPLEYSVSTPTELKVSINGVEGAYLVEGEGVLRLSLQTGINKIEASFTGADNMVYSVVKEVFYTWVSPTIQLHEDLDGMTFMVGKVPVSGQVEEAVKVTVNGVETPIAEDGSFSGEVLITEGENTITIEAVSAMGVSAVQTMTVVGEGAGGQSASTGNDGSGGDKPGESSDGETSEDASSGEISNVKNMLGKWLPTILIGVACLVLLIFFFAVIKDKKKKKTITARFRNLLIFFGLLEAVLGLVYYQMYSYNNSLEYVTLAQTSVQAASAYLNYETYAKYALIGVGGIIILLIVILLLIGGIKKLKAKRAEKKNNAAEASE